MTDPTYGTYDVLKQRLGLTSDGDMSLLSDILYACSRQVEEDCGRRFWLDSVPVARVYNPHRRTSRTEQGYLFQVDDIGVVDGTQVTVEVGHQATASSSPVYTAIPDWELGPDNAFIRNRPWTWILRWWRPWIYNPLDRIRVTTQFGWPTVPYQIDQATYLLSQRIYKRRNSSEGVVGFADMGAIRIARTDPDYQALISPFQITGFGNQ